MTHNTHATHAMPDSPSYDDIVNKVIEILSEQSGYVTTLDSTLREDGLDLDSLDYASIASTLEAEFNLAPIADNDLFKFVTVSQIVDYVVARKKVESDAAEVRRLSEQTV